MATIDSAYHYYLSTYGTSKVSRYDTHKKSQLRAVYNQIVKTNKDTPLYRIPNSTDVKKFAIDLKEHTRSIQNVIASLSEHDEQTPTPFSKKVARSSDTAAITASYIGDDQSLDNSLHFNVEVKQLAAPQINIGTFLYPDDCNFKTGTYSFDLSTELNSYEFQYTVNKHDDNQHILEKLAKLVNSSGAGVHADIARNANRKIALRLTSKQTGLSDGQTYLFEISASSEHASQKALHTLGIDYVLQAPCNSSFLLNGTEHASLSNTFTVNNAFELTLNKPSSNTPVQIGFQTPADAIADNVQSLMSVYNNLIQLSYHYEGTQEAEKLRRDITQVVKPYYNEFESFGLQQQENGEIKVDHHLLADAVTSDDAATCFGALNGFKQDLSAVVDRVSVDPLNYASKTLITYKKPGYKNFSCPYLTSVYSGMMLDRYC